MKKYLLPLFANFSARFSIAQDFRNGYVYRWDETAAAATLELGNYSIYFEARKES